MKAVSNFSWIISVRMKVFSTKLIYAGVTVYLNFQIPSGNGNKGSPTGVIPKLDEVRMLKSLTVKGKLVSPNPGTVTFNVGEDTTGGSVGYVEASAIPNVSTLYVGITNMSSFKSAILHLKKMPEDFEKDPLTLWHRLCYLIVSTIALDYGILVEVVLVVGQIVVVVEVVVIQTVSPPTVPKAASKIVSNAAAIPLTSAFGAAMITVLSSIM
jgi:hypothetical protein